MLRKHKLIYFAGLLDGEGCFHRANPKYRGIRTYRSDLIFNNTNKEVIDWIKENFGGYIAMQIRQPVYKDIYRWQQSGKKAEKLAKELYPFLIIKREEAKKIIPGFQEYKTRIDMRTKEYKNSLSAKLKIKELNKNN